MNDLQEFITALTGFLNNIVLPFLFTLALLFFIYNAAQFFIFQSASDQGRERAKQLALWSIAAFVFLVTLWGTIGLLLNSLGLNTDDAPATPDYIERFRPDQP